MCQTLFMLKFVQNFKKFGRRNDPKMGSKSQKAWILGVFSPKITVCSGCIFLQNSR